LGPISSFEDVEKIWDHIFKEEIRADPAEQPILLTEPPLNSKDNREKIAQSFFEKFRAPSIFIGQSGILSLFSYGQTSGLVLQSGHAITHAIPVVEGRALEKAVLPLSFAGDHLTQHYQQIFSSKKHSFVYWSHLEELRNLNETLSYIAIDLEAEKKKKVERKYQLPDETYILVENEQFLAPEAFFDTKLYKKDLESTGVHNLVFEAIQKCESSQRKALAAKVFLAGGSTLIKGFAARLEKELNKLGSSSLEFKVAAPTTERRPEYAAWIGGSILGSLSSFSSLSVTKQQYEESGASSLKFGF